ncbi:LysR family transcriptional regulator [Maridesulfovibrio sp.]|uniref:LysR family transcriptional regulator n=1 Tax=Maridesulfovibrio sp. TaxID=2795000 RepID=UPI0029F46C8B|nr:LysR family transcriptional regulator [Maridesulfovibrio sp.]
MQLNIEYLRTFIAVATSQSFTRAAAQVHRSQSAVSMQIKRLEEEIGRPLFVRDGKTARLTSDGKLLISLARGLVQSHDEAVVSLLNAQLEGVIRFGAPEHYTIGVLPKLLVGFARSYPDVLVKFQSKTSDVVKKAVDAGELDLGLCTAPVEGGHGLIQEAVVWAAGPSFELKQLPFIPLAVEDGCIFQDWALRALAEAGIPYRIVYVSQGLSGVFDAARAGLAVTPAIKRTIPADLAVLGSEHGLPALPQSSISLVFRDGPIPDSVNCFAEHIADAFQGGVDL